MGPVQTAIVLANPARPDLAPIEVEALVDTGALHLCIPPHVALQLQVEEQDKREVTTAGGGKHLLSYVGPIMASFGKRTCFTGAMVIGTQVCLGAIPMDDMDLVVRPSTREVLANPASPNFPASIVIGL